MTSARICDCGSGPNVARCRDGHLERVKARERTDCPHRLTAEEAAPAGKPEGAKCGKGANVLKTAATLPEPDRGELAPEPGADGIWPGEAPPAHWRDALGEEDPGAEPCPDESETACGCGSPAPRYSSDHTGSVCPSCGPQWCWGVSVAASARAQAHNEEVKRKAARAGTASIAIPQSELDRQDRELRQRRKIVLAVVGKVLADPHLTPQCRTDWEWYEEKIPGADAARLAELEEQIRGEPVDRRGWWRRSFGPGEIRDYLEWAAEGADDDEPDAPSDESEGQAAGEVISISSRQPVAAIEATPGLSGSVLCEVCHGEGRPSFAVARIRSNVPSMVPERDVCPGHFRHFAAIIEPMTFGDLVIVKQYGTAPGVRSIIKSGAGPAREA
jgi:hypothetical protein